MLGLAHTLVAEDLHDRDFLDRYCVGFDELARLPRSARATACRRTPRGPRRSPASTPATIEALARRMAGAPHDGHRRPGRCSAPTTASSRSGWASRWPRCSGQIGLPGGGFGTGYGSMADIGRPRPDRRRIAALAAGPNPVTRRSSRSRASPTCCSTPGGTIDYNGQRLTLSPTSASSTGPAATRSTTTRTSTACARAWRRPDTIVVHEPYWTADRAPRRHRPPGDHHARARRHRPPAARLLIRDAPGGRAARARPRNDYEICRARRAARLRRRLHRGPRRRRVAAAPLRLDCARPARPRASTLPDFDEFWDAGRVELPDAGRCTCARFAAFRADPDGAPLRTPSRPIELYSETIAAFGYDDCPGHPAWLEPAEWLGSPSARAASRCT